MTLPGFLAILRYELWLFTGGLALLIAYRLLTGTISLDSILKTKAPPGASSPARLQLLLFTLAAAVYYAWSCIHIGAFAPVPSVITTGLGGSNVLYLLGKYNNAQTA